MYANFLKVHYYLREYYHPHLKLIRRKLSCNLVEIRQTIYIQVRYQMLKMNINVLPSTQNELKQLLSAAP